MNRSQDLQGGNMDLDLNSTLVRNHHASTAPVDDELVILNMKGNNYLTLDEIGRHIWDLLATPIRAEALCNRLVDLYTGEREKIEQDTITFLRRLAQDDLIHVSSD